MITVTVKANQHPVLIMRARSGDDEAVEEVTIEAGESLSFDVNIRDALNLGVHEMEPIEIGVVQSDEDPMTFHIVVL